MIDKKKLRKSLFVIALIIVIVITAIQIRKTLARYESTATTEGDVDVAFYILDNDYQTDTVFIDGIYPSANPFEYTFSISNFKDEKVAETDLEYEFEITTTTNMPLSYEITKNGTTYTSLQDELVSDDSGTVLRKLKTDIIGMDTIVNTDGNNQKTKITDTYVLKVTFPLQTNTNGTVATNRENLEYADLIEDVTISLSSRQVLSD